jgi:hypothetical protein
MLRGGYTSVKESRDKFEDILLSDPSLQMGEQKDKEQVVVFVVLLRSIAC